MTQTTINAEASAASATTEQIEHIKVLLSPTLRRLSEPAAQVIIDACHVLQKRFGEFVSELVDQLAVTYSVTVNHGRSLKQMIRAGKYGFIGRCVKDMAAEYFPVGDLGEMTIEITLIRPSGKGTTYEGALAELDSLGFRPAKIEELLAFGAMYPGVQRQFKVIGFGTVWKRQGIGHIPCLEERRGKRSVCLQWVGCVWISGCVFAAVRK